MVYNKEMALIIKFLIVVLIIVPGLKTINRGVLGIAFKLFVQKRTGLEQERTIAIFP